MTSESNAAANNSKSDKKRGPASLLEKAKNGRTKYPSIFGGV